MPDIETKLNFPSFFRFLQASSKEQQHILPLYHTSKANQHPQTTIQVFSAPPMVQHQKIK